MKISLTLMGILAPGSVHARLCVSPPIDMSVDFPAHVSAESTSNISPSCSKISEYYFKPFWNFFEINPCPPKIALFGGIMGVP